MLRTDAYCLIISKILVRFLVEATQFFFFSVSFLIECLHTIFSES